MSDEEKKEVKPDVSDTVTASVADAKDAQAAAPPKVKKKKESKHRIKNFFVDFKKFITKGNIIDLAVAVVIGGAFGAIVTSLVNNIIMPLISLAVGKNVLAALRTPIGDGTTFIEWGIFLQKIIDFLIIALIIFIILRLLVTAQKGIVSAKVKMHAKLQKKIEKNKEKNPELAAKLEVEAAKLAVEVATPPPPIESTDDILKDIRTLLTMLAPKQEPPVPELPPKPPADTEAAKEV